MVGMSDTDKWTCVLSFLPSRVVIVICHLQVVVTSDDKQLILTECMHKVVDFATVWCQLRCQHALGTVGYAAWAKSMTGMTMPLAYEHLSVAATAQQYPRCEWPVNMYVPECRFDPQGHTRGCQPLQVCTGF
jgi:hypothetical protein